MVVSLANFRRVRNEMRARRAEQVADLLPSMIVAVAVASSRPLPNMIVAVAVASSRPLPNMIVAVAVASSRPLPNTVAIQPSRNVEDDEALVRDAEYLAALVARRQLELRQHASSLRMEQFDDDTENDG